MSRLDTLAVEEHHGFDEVNRAVYRAGLGDGLPVVPPTPARVAAMLGERPPHEVVAVLPPARGEVTLRRLALCAVMAGCLPGHLPVLVAACEALAEPELNLLGVATTTGSAAVGAIVHGPVARLCELNGEANALGPGNLGNATIGRALSLVLRNIAGAVPGRMDMATQGQPAKYGLCFAENTARSPWEPLHVARGCESGASAVTVFAAAGTSEIVDMASRDGAGVLTTIAHSMLQAGALGGRTLLGGGEPLVLLAPEHAEVVAADFDRAGAQEFLFRRARLPLERLAPEVRAHLLEGLAPGTEPPRSLAVADGPGAILLAVVGGVGRKSTFVPTWGGGTRAVTRTVANR